MKRKTTVVILALCFAFGAICFAKPQMGTSKLNKAKPKFASRMSKNSIVIAQAAGDNSKVTVDGRDTQGKRTHSEWLGKFDGND